jgi:hypothetical protein
MTDRGLIRAMGVLVKVVEPGRGGVVMCCSVYRHGVCGALCASQTGTEPTSHAAASGTALPKDSTTPPKSAHRARLPPRSPAPC